MFAPCKKMSFHKGYKMAFIGYDLKEDGFVTELSFSGGYLQVSLSPGMRSWFGLMEMVPFSDFQVQDALFVWTDRNKATFDCARQSISLNVVAGVKWVVRQQRSETGPRVLVCRGGGGAGELVWALE